MTRPCKHCGQPITFAVSEHGRSVAMDAQPIGVYVLAKEAGRNDPVEPRVKYVRAWRPHQESCNGKVVA